jgi:hypothetical protein
MEVNTVRLEFYKQLLRPLPEGHSGHLGPISCVETLELSVKQGILESHTYAREATTMTEYTLTDKGLQMFLTDEKQFSYSSGLEPDEVIELRKFYDEEIAK